MWSKIIWNLESRSYYSWSICLACSLDALIIFQVLLVSSHSKPGRWIIPGGKIQANEDAGTSAAREAMEEAGARGRLGRTLGTFADPDRKHRTTVFVLHVDPENGGLVDDFEEKVWECVNYAKWYFP